MRKNSPGPWLVCLTVAASIPLIAASTTGQTSPAFDAAGSGNTNASMSASAAGKRAPWQDHLTLGPGDTLNLSLLILAPRGTAGNGGLFTTTESRTEVPIGPDGRISFLQAREIMATGLTIDELRAKLDEVLGNFYQNPRTIVTPAATRSKRYVVMGAVGVRGVYTFERPLTVIEAIARAGGLQTGLYEDRAVEMADLGHSFLVRDGRRVPLDFERLFQQGDLSQNTSLAPGDYLYFASASVNEIYVLGEVSNPGPLVFAPKPTAMNAIASRGGFTEKAYRRRVLVVRGSLEHPEAFVVESSAIVSGKAADFKLEPKDIVYVSSSAWVRAEDLLDTAARAFIQGTIVTWTTLHVTH